MQATGNKQHQAYSLSIRLHADGFSFYTYNPSLNEPVAIENHLFKDSEFPVETLKKALSNSETIQRNDYVIVYGLVTTPSIQIPLEHFRKEEANTLYRLTYAQEKTGKTYYNILPHLEVAQVFTIDNEIEQVLCKQFPNIRFYHSNTMILERISMMESQKGQRLYVHFREHEMMVFAYKEQRLIYCNTFPLDVAENAVYFILSVWKSLEYDAETAECLLLGENPLKKDTTQILSKYLRTVKNTPSKDFYRRSALARNEHVPFDLLALLSNVI